MTTITIQITTGASWYRKLIGRKYEVKSDGRYFRLIDRPVIAIDENHAVVTAVNYEDES